MDKQQLFQAAADYFHADPRVAAMPYLEFDGFYNFASSHQMDPSDDQPEDYKEAYIRQEHGKPGFIAWFPATDNFLDGPFYAEWDANGNRTEFFWFDGDARTLTGHEALRYAAYQSKVRSPAQAVAA